jgi:hypothetical protein
VKSDRILKKNLRPAGIDGLKWLPFGTHFCCLYENKREMMSALAGYLIAGLT